MQIITHDTRRTEGGFYGHTDGAFMFPTGPECDLQGVLQVQEPLCDVKVGILNHSLQKCMVAR